MQTILGSGGAIGIELAKALPSYTGSIRLVSRNPKPINENDELFTADLTIASQVDEAIKGSDVVYVTVGFPYSLKVWRETWPPFIRNVIDACQKHEAKLVLFDNIYMYHPAYINHMTEETPIDPATKKGDVRKEVAQLVMEAVEQGKIEALIARSADFYGPSIKQTSFLTIGVFKPFAKGKKANWLGGVSYKHSFTYTPDAGKATAILGNSAEAYNQVWHVPTAPSPPTGKEWIQAIADEMNMEPRYQVTNKLMVRGLGIFVPIMREMVEMMYQYESDYVFDSDKFEHYYQFTPTPYLEGIRHIVATDYKAYLTS